MPIHLFLLMIALMKSILVKKGVKKKMKKIVSIKKMEINGLQQKQKQTACSNASIKQSDGIMSPCTTDIENLCAEASVPQSTVSFSLWLRKTDSLIVSYCIYFITKIHK